MTQQYTPVTWQDETTSQQGTLINAERLNQMQTAHHYADGFEEVDAVPADDPGVAYHKVVYCTADSTFYRWDGTEWTKDIDDETKRLLLEHEADHDNPHQVTKAQVGLGNVDNTSDQDKPVSTAQAAAIKLVQDYLDAHEANHSNPHQVTKAQVGLGNADNTADADKPISTAAQAALDGKVSIIPVTTGVKFYAQTSGGTSLYQGTANAQTGITSVPLRDSSGRIKTETPSADTDCANKKYADDGLATKADKATTYTKSETDTLLVSKADVATTLAGYGITDAYTKTETDTLLSAKANDSAVVKLTGDQTVGGIKYFTNGINVPSTGKTSIWGGDSGTFTINAAGGGFNRITCKNANRTIDLTVDANVLRVPTPPDGASTLGAVNIAYLDGYLPMVRTTGNQDIAGLKTFEYVIHKEFVTKDTASVGANTWRRLYNIASSSSGSNRHVTIEMPNARGTACAILDIMWGGLSGSPTAEVMHRGAPIEIRVCRATDGHIEVWTNDHVYSYVTFEGIRTAGQINVVTAALSPADTTEPVVGDTYSAVVTPTVIQ